MKCCILVQHFITKSRSLLVDQSELLYSSVEQLLIIIIAVLSKQTKDWQERKRCTSGVDEKWRYRLQARTMAAWLTGHIKRCNWDKTQYPNLFVFFLLLLPLFFFFKFIYVANLEFIKGEWATWAHYWDRYFVCFFIFTKFNFLIFFS